MVKRISHKHLISAKKNKNDEFYTQYKDIEAELKHYSNFFENKVVYCSFDNPEWSNFAKYFADNFHELKLKKLICSHCSPNEVPTSMVYDGKEKAVTELLSGSFDSKECLDLLKEADIVVTNPPFSLWREFFNTMMDYNKDFIIIGTNNAFGYANVFPYLKSGKVSVGFTTPKKFVIPPHVEARGKISTSDESLVSTWKNYTTLGNCCWFTTLPVSKDKPWLETGVKYNKDNYCKYVNYDAINVDEVKDIPDDYEGVMGVPISFWNKINREQFEVVGQYYGDKPLSDEFIRVYHENGGGQINPNILGYFNKEGKAIAPYTRLLIKRISCRMGEYKKQLKE